MFLISANCHEHKVKTEDLNFHVCLAQLAHSDEISASACLVTRWTTIV